MYVCRHAQVESIIPTKNKVDIHAVLKDPFELRAAEPVPCTRKTMLWPGKATLWQAQKMGRDQKSIRAQSMLMLVILVGALRSALGSLA